MINIGDASDRLLHRLTAYYHFLRKYLAEDKKYISSEEVAKTLHLSPILVRKDFETSGILGKPRCGYPIKETLDAIELFLGWKNRAKSIIIGCGNLGQALMKYNDFNKYGINISDGFDTNNEIIGKKINNIKIHHISKLEEIVKKNQPLVAILATPERVAQEITDIITKLGIQVIWNFVPTFLSVPQCTVVQQQDLFPFITVRLNQIKCNSEIGEKK